MNEVVVLRGAEPRKILQTVIEKKVPAIMSYLSRDKWRGVKVLPTELGAGRFCVAVSPRERGPVLREDCKEGAQKPHPINIRVGQPVGMSLKYGYGKFIFETTVLGLEPSPDLTVGGVVVLAVPGRIELVQRRSYFRVDVPESLEVSVTLWHHRHTKGEGDRLVPPEHYWQGRLADISAGGAQIAIDAAQRPDFRRGQFIGLRFTPAPYEKPLMLDAQIRDVLPTADGESICLGLRIVGLEASRQGQEVLSRLVEVVERYYQINQSGVRQQDFQHSGRCKV